jgi:DNA-binding CsgD family transcriptional regulator
VCLHADREVIDRALVDGRSYRDIARQRGLSKDAVSRHRSHISPALVAVQAQRQESAARTLLDRVEQLIGRAEAFLQQAETSGQVAQGLAAIREIRGLLELLGKASGELDERQQVTINLLQSPEILRYLAVVREVLADQPDRMILISKRLMLPESGS